MGRPEVMTDIVIAKLEEAFSNDATDVEACFYAGISRSTLHNYQVEHPEFIERKEALKDFIKYRAKKNLIAQITDDETPNIETSKWWLERRAKSDFAQRSEHTGKEGKDLPVPIFAEITPDVQINHSNTEDTPTQ